MTAEGIPRSNSSLPCRILPASQSVRFERQKSGLKEVLSVHLEEVNIDKEDNEQTWSGDLDSNIEQRFERGVA